MATKGRYTRLLVNEFDFSGVTNKIGVKLGADRLETTAFQETAATSIAGDTTGSISSNGYFQNADAGEFVQEMQESIANTEALYVAALFGTDVAACEAFVARATNTGALDIEAVTGGLITTAAEWHQGTGIRRGFRVWTGTISATGAQAAPAYIDLAIPGAAGGAAWLFVQNITGAATNATIQVQSATATNFTTPATKATFTFSAKGGYEQPMTGVVDRYLRINTTSLGGATNFTVVVIAGVAGVTY